MGSERRKMENKYDYQLTQYVGIRSTLDFAVKQLEKYGAEENEDFIVKERQAEYGAEYAVFKKGTPKEKQSYSKQLHSYLEVGV